MNPRWVDADARVAFPLTLNGTATTVEVGSRWTLADAIRSTGLTGTHVGCEHGICGTCTVLLDDAPVRACLVLALQASGRAVETVEALGEPGALHPVQEAFRRARAQQCGFCTPGFVVLAAWLRTHEPDAGEERIREVLSSNLCRCTGYGPILDAASQT